MRTPDAAKQTLYDRMSQISQDCWAAGWMQGTEYALWAAMQCVEPVAWGAGVVTQRDIEALCALSAWANGWWMRVGHEPVFISLTEWRAHYAEWKERGESEADA